MNKKILSEVIIHMMKRKENKTNAARIRDRMIICVSESSHYSVKNAKRRICDFGNLDFRSDCPYDDLLND